MTNAIVNQAIDYCESNKHRLTQPRIEVLKIIASHDKPIGAYDVLKELGRVIIDPKPPTVYRAIEFWHQHGFIHRIESLNAYMTCDAGHQHDGSQFLICDECGVVIEMHHSKLPESLKSSVNTNSFVPSKWNLEIHGLCKECV